MNRYRKSQEMAIEIPDTHWTTQDSGKVEPGAMPRHRSETQEISRDKAQHHMRGTPSHPF
nr:hypothetical protein [Acidithiobacillus ferrianus]